MNKSLNSASNKKPIMVRVNLRALITILKVFISGNPRLFLDLVAKRDRPRSPIKILLDDIEESLVEIEKEKAKEETPPE